jgi:hypothetical protein
VLPKAGPAESASRSVPAVEESSADMLPREAPESPTSSRGLVRSNSPTPGSPEENGSMDQAVQRSLVRPRIRLQNNIRKPNQFADDFVCLLTTVSEPRCFDEAVQEKEWRQAMDVEFQALGRNKTWHLVPREEARNIIDSKWVYKVKKTADGNIDQYKARLVVKGFK